MQLSLVASTTSRVRRRPDLPPVCHHHQNHESEDASDATPPRHFPELAAAPVGDFESENGRLRPLAKELEQRMQAFEDDARLIRSLNQEEEFRNLKDRFNSWKKDFKARLRETKVALRKPEGDKKQRRWWVKRAIKI